jgi:hypothetical protein
MDMDMDMGLRGQTAEGGPLLSRRSPKHNMRYPQV